MAKSGSSSLRGDWGRRTREGLVVGEDAAALSLMESGGKIDLMIGAASSSGRGQVDEEGGG